MAIKDWINRLLNRDARVALTDSQTADLAPLQFDMAGHPARNLTPTRLHAILAAAETGDLTAQADLFCDMEERDAHLYAEMSKRKRALLTLPWQIAPPPNASAAEQAHADEVAEWLRDIPDFEDVLLDQLDGIGHGFAALEISWERQGQIWLPEQLTHRPQRWFQTPPYQGDDLRLRDGSVTGAELWPLGWLVHRHKAKSGYLTRAGLHRVLAWPYLFKHYSVRDLAEFLEIYGLPLRLGKYPAGATKDEKATLLRAVTQIGHAAAGIIPQGMAIEFEEAAKGSHDPFQAMIDWCEKSMSKAILGGTLTSQADGKTSTNALGSVHNEVRRDLMQSDARQLAGTLSTGLVLPLLILNKAGFDPRRPPRFVFDVSEPEDIVAYADALPKLVGVGFRIPREWGHERLGIPVADEDEPVLSTSTPAVSAPGAKPMVAALSQELPEAPAAAFTDQTALDEALDTLPASGLQGQAEALLAPVLAAIRDSDDETTLLGRLAELYPQLPEEGLREELARLMFIADTWGRLSAQTEVQ